MKRIAFLVVLLGHAASAAAQGYYAPPPPRGYVHDGFFMRFNLGAAYVNMRQPDQELTLQGGGGSFAFSLGGAVAPNLQIFASLFADVAVRPTLSVGNQSFGTDQDVNAGTRGFGVGLNYYTPSNIFFGAALTATQIAIQENGNDAGESDFGPGVKGTIGKEWWVSPDWGLGVAGELSFASMSDRQDGPRWNTFSVSVTFSATYD